MILFVFLSQCVVLLSDIKLLPNEVSWRVLLTVTTASNLALSNLLNISAWIRDQVSAVIGADLLLSYCLSFNLADLVAFDITVLVNIQLYEEWSFYFNEAHLQKIYCFFYAKTFKLKVELIKMLHQIIKNIF